MAGPRDVRLGEAAVTRGWLTPDELEDILREQEALRARGQAVRLGSLLVTRGLLTEEQIGELLGTAVGASPAEAIRSDRRRKNLIYGGLGAVIVALCAVLMMLAGDMFGGGGGPAEPEPVEDGPERPATGPTPTRPTSSRTARPGNGGGEIERPGRPGPSSEERTGGAALAAAEAFFEKNPDDVDGMQTRLRDIIAQHPAVAAEARMRMKEVEKRREQLAELAYVPREQAGRKAFEAGDVSKAVAVFDDFPTRLRNTSWYGKVGEWLPGLRGQAVARCDAAANAATPLLQEGKVNEAVTALDVARPYERLAAEAEGGRIVVDMVQGLRIRAEWLARGEARKQLEQVVPALLEVIGRRDFTGARALLDARVSSEGNPMLREEAASLRSDVAGAERACALVEGRLRALAAGKQEWKTLVNGAERAGTLELGGGSPPAIVFRAGDQVVPMGVATLAPRDLLRIAADPRVPPFPKPARFALALVCLGAGAWAEARDILAEFVGPRAREYQARAEASGEGELGATMNKDLAVAREKAGAGDWKAAREAAERLRAKVGWPVDGERGLRREMADLWSRAETELLGIARLVTGVPSALPEGRVQVVYDFGTEDHVRDFEARGGPAPALSGRRLHVPDGGMGWHRLDFPGATTVAFRAMGREFGIVLASTGGADGYQCIFGRGGEAVVLRDGQVLARSPCAIDPSREYEARVWRKGAHIALDIEGREVLGLDEQSPISGRGRVGLVGGPTGTLYGNVIVEGVVDLQAVKAAVGDAEKSRRAPGGTLALQKGTTMDGWNPLRGEWSCRKGAIWGKGTDGYCIHRDLQKWDVGDYTFAVEVRRTLRRSDMAAVMFRVGNKDVVWVIGDGAGEVQGLPGVAMASGVDDLSFKFKQVVVQVKKGIVRGFIDKVPAFEAKADAADGAAKFGGALAGFGLGVKAGEVAFRNPVFKAG